MKERSKNSLNKVKRAIFLPVMLGSALAIGYYAEHNELKTGEFKKLNNNQVKTKVFTVTPGGRQDTYDFATDSVSQYSALPIPATKKLPFNELKDTSDLHIARLVQDNGFSSARKVNKGYSGKSYMEFKR